MFSRLNAKSRAWILLMAWVLFTGLAVADTFDLSDDIALPTALEQPALAALSPDERKPHAVALSGCLDRELQPPSLLRDRDVSPAFFIPFASDPPCYLCESVLRI